MICLSLDLCRSIGSNADQGFYSPRQSLHQVTVLWELPNDSGMTFFRVLVNYSSCVYEGQNTMDLRVMGEQNCVGSPRLYFITVPRAG